MQIKGGWTSVGIMWKSKGGCKRRHFVQIKRVDLREGNFVNEKVDGKAYDVHIGWMDKG